MLKTIQSISITGSSYIGEGGAQKAAMYFSATINTESGQTNTNSVVQDVDVYESNKEQCRMDEDDFRALVRKVEDAQQGGTK